MPKHTVSPSVLFSVLFVLLMACTSALGQQTRGLQVKVKNPTGATENVQLYKGSFAFLVGVSNYTAGWPSLPSVPKELGDVEKLLQDMGFHVEKLLNPNGSELEAGFRNFINRYGLERENRLLFYYSGHGHTRNGGQKGYLVPIDAPDPKKDLTGFLQRSLGMNQVLSWARDIEAKHALFLFDSCFSGSIFTQKAAITPPPHITRLTIEPVRQFITAGGAGEEVPATSSFTPAFIAGLRQGLADLNKDGYVSATELGLYLQTELPDKTDQTPQYGKIRDYDLARGDFIFAAGGNSTEPPTSPIAAPAAAGDAGILKVDSTPAGAGVYVGDTFQGNTPILLNNIAPGSYGVRAEKRGFLSETKFIEVRPSQQVTVGFQLIALAAEGSLTVVTHPTGSKIDILEYHGSYQPGMKLPAGKYTISVSKYGFHPETTSLQISENEDLHLNVTLRRDPSIVSPDNREIEAAAPPAKAVQYTQESPSEPPVIEAEKVKVVHQEKPERPRFSPEIEGYLKGLRSSDSGTKRNTAKSIYRKRVFHPAVLATVEAELLKGASLFPDDRYHVDAMAWMCNVLGGTDRKNYISTLERVSRSAGNTKIRKYAEKNIRLLQ